MSALGRYRTLVNLNIAELIHKRINDNPACRHNKYRPFFLSSIERPLSKKNSVNDFMQLSSAINDTAPLFISMHGLV